MPLNAKTTRLLQEMAPGETVLDGGPAKCKVLDRRVMDALEQKLGGVANVRRYAKTTGGGLNFMEAEWVATERALYYVSYHPGSAYRWTWDEIEDMSPGKRGRLLPTRLVTVSAHGMTFSLSMGRLAADSLLAIGSRMRKDSISLGDPRAAALLASLPHDDLPLVVTAQVDVRPPPPLSSWSGCPDCGGDLVFLPDRRAADCAGCRLVWCDPNLGPLTIEIGPDEGKLIGTESRPALMSYEIRAGEHEKVRAFIRRPRPGETPLPLP